VSVQLHFALFNGSQSYVLKPFEMRVLREDDGDDFSSCHSSSRAFFIRRGTGGAGLVLDGISEKEVDVTEDEQHFWPPWHDYLHRITVDVLTLHNLPKRGEQRPSHAGSRGLAHKYHPELSGQTVPPNKLYASSPSATVSLHPIGGFCAASLTLELEERIDTEVTLPVVERNGMNAVFEKKVHCFAAEPHATFIRVSITDGNTEVAYETAVLGRLKCGYRVFRLRGAALGARIELAFVFVRISSGCVKNEHATPAQRERKLKMRDHEVGRLQERIAELTNKLESTSCRTASDAADNNLTNRFTHTTEPDSPVT